MYSFSIFYACYLSTMNTLYHFPLCPFSRKLRVFLKEKGISFELVTENFWERREEFSYLNPAVQVPVLVEPEGNVLCDSQAIAEYVEEALPENSLIGPTLGVRAEVRRLVSWFDSKFFLEVTRYVINEKIIKYFSKTGQPNSEALRAAKANILSHMDYIAYLTQGRKWLAGEQFSLADIAAACHLSVLDYLGDVPWQHYPEAKEWYALVKSRPSFRPILADRVPGFLPASHYSNPDF